MKTASWAMGLAFLCTMLTASAQVLMKFGANRLSLSFIGLITNVPLILALFVYFIGSILVIVALKHGELSVLYPILATSYVWVTFLSSFFFGEIVNQWKLLGVITIIIGVSFIGMGGRR